MVREKEKEMKLSKSKKTALGKTNTFIKTAMELLYKNLEKTFSSLIESSEI